MERLDFPIILEVDDIKAIMRYGSKNTAYKLVQRAFRTGEFAVKRDGGWKINRDSFFAWLELATKEVSK